MASIVMLEVPKGTEVGIDLSYWNCGPNFVGLKNISPGTHFVYWSSTAQECKTRSCLRTGRFLVIENPSQRLFWRWNKFQETFEDCSEEEKDSVKTNWQDMVPRLGPIDSTNSRSWNALSKYISRLIIDKICPDNRPVYSATQLISLEYRSSSRTSSDIESSPMSRKMCSNLSEAESKLPKMEESENERLCYSRIDKVPIEGLSAREITSCHLDHSSRLRNLMEENYPTNKLYILGELQFSFICFLIGQNYDSFEHWKRLVDLICNSDALLKDMPKLFNVFMLVLHFQLQQIPSDFFVDILTASNFLVSVLHVLFTNVQLTEGVNTELKLRSEKFQKYLTSKFGWDFMSEPYEWSPTIVK